jgi:hypothetical protein
VSVNYPNRLRTPGDAIKVLNAVLNKNGGTLVRLHRQRIEDIVALMEKAEKEQLKAKKDRKDYTPSDCGGGFRHKVRHRHSGCFYRRDSIIAYHEG